MVRHHLCPPHDRLASPSPRHPPFRGDGLRVQYWDQRKFSTIGYLVTILKAKKDDQCGFPWKPSTGWIRVLSGESILSCTSPIVLLDTSVVRHSRFLRNPDCKFPSGSRALFSLINVVQVAVLIGEVIGRFTNDWFMNWGIRRNHGVFNAEVRLW